MAGQDHDFQEHFEAGFRPHAVLERYYMCARPGQPFNRVVDISSQIDRKDRSDRAVQVAGRRQQRIVTARAAGARAEAARHPG